MSDSANSLEEKWINGVLHTITSEGDWKPNFNKTIYKIGTKIILKIIMITFILNVILVDQYRKELFSLYGLPFLHSPMHPIFRLLIIYGCAVAFYFVLGHGIQDTYADTDSETGMKKLLPFKLAFTKFVLGTWVVNLYLSYFFAQVLGLDSLGLTILIFFPISILISILFVYIERSEYHKVEKIWTLNLAN